MFAIACEVMRYDCGAVTIGLYGHVNLNRADNDPETKKRKDVYISARGSGLGNLLTKVLWFCSVCFPKFLCPLCTRLERMRRV